jgi:hypothetical protein
MNLKNLLILPLLVTTLQAASVNDLTFTLNGDGTEYSVQDCDQNASGSLEIPSTFDGLPVTSIGYMAFWNCSSLTSVTIPDSFTSIGDRAFGGCTGLTSIEIGSSVISIGDYAFLNCYSLTSIAIPGSVTSIEDYLFYNCTSLTSITIPNSVNSIGYSAFSNCSGLTSITIPASVTSIGDSAFSNSGLTSITIPDSVTSIGEEVFRSCSGLTSITIPESVTSIGYQAFAYCTSLTSINIPSSVTSISPAAFDGCNALSITLNNASLDLYSVGSGLYNRVTNIIIPEGTTEIALRAFFRCRLVTSITIPDSVTSIGASAFADCTSLTSINIPGSVSSIGSSAFYNCSGLTSVTIPDSVNSIGNYALAYCSGLTSVIFEGDAPTFGTDLFTESGSVTVYYNSNYSGWSSTVAGRTAVRIDPMTFSQSGNGTEFSVTDSDVNASGSLEIPSTYNDLPVTSIGNASFINRYGVTSITIPDSVTSIGDNAFSGCTSLTSINIPSSVTSIGEGAFNNCNALSIALNNASLNLSSPDIHSRVTSITIPEGTTEIAYKAFNGCSNVTNITIPDSVTSIGNMAFRGCTGLTSITIPDGVTSIGDSTFANCSNLASVTIPDSVNSIVFSAFNNCTSLNSISFSNPLLEAAEAERDARPTQAAYDTVVAERDAKFTLDEVKDLRAGSTMIAVENETATLSMEIEKSSDLSNWTFDRTTTVDIPIEDGVGTQFFRFKMADPATTITVTVGVDTIAGQNTGVFYFNGAEKAVLEFEKGTKYTFIQNDSSNATYASIHHPLMFSTGAGGDLFGNGHYTAGVVYKLDGVTVNMAGYVSGFVAASDRRIEWTVSSDAPSTLYYWCHIHTGQGAAMTVID